MDDTNKAAFDQQTQGPNPVLLPLTRLVGTWKWDATLHGEPFGRGRTVFEWLEGGAFLLERSNAEQREFPNSTAVIGGDDTTGAYCGIYVDSRTVSRIYQMSISEGVWKQWRDAPGFSQRFTGTFDPGGNTITGGWEKCEDGSRWEYDFDMTYTRIS